MICGEGVSQVAIARLPGRNPEGNPEGKSEKVGLGSQRGRNEDRQGGKYLGHFSGEKCESLTNYAKTPNPGRFPEGKVGESGRIPGRVFFRTRQCRNKFQSSYQ